MEIKEELKQYKYRVKQVELLLEEFEKYRTKAEKITPTISETTARTNKTSDKVGDNAIILADLDKEYKKRLNLAENEKLIVIDKITRIEQPYSLILLMVYVQGKTFEKIAEELECSEKTIQRKHKIALRKFRRL